jgi:hypothetical protein
MIHELQKTGSLMNIATLRTVYRRRDVILDAMANLCRKVLVGPIPGQVVLMDDDAMMDMQMF